MKKINIKILSLCVLMLAPFSGQAGVVDVSKSYLDKYIEYVDSVSEDKLEISTAEKNLKSAKSKAQSNLNKQKSVNIEIGQQWENKKKLPAQIEWSKNKIAQTEDEIDSLMRRYFPNITDISSAEAQIVSEENHLRRQIESLDRELRDKEAFDLPRIEQLEDKLSEQRSRRASLKDELQNLRNNIKNLRAEVQDLRDDNERIRRSTQGQRDEIARIQSLMDDSRALKEQIRKTKADHDLAEKKRKEKRIRCNRGNSGERICNRLKAAKQKLRRLRAIRDGSHIKKLKRELQADTRGIKRNREEIQDIKVEIEDEKARAENKKARVERVTGKIVRNQQELKAIRSDYRSEVAEINRRKQGVNNRLAGVSAKRNRITQIVKLQETAAAHTRSLKHYESSLSQADAKIAQLKGSLSALKTALPGLQANKQQAQAEYNDKLQVVADKKQTVLESGLDLKDSLANEPLELQTGLVSVVPAEETLLESKDWQVILSSSSDLSVGRNSCKAQTQELSDDESVELKLSVMKMKNDDDSGYSEPMVVVTVKLKDPVVAEVEEGAEVEVSAEVEVQEESKKTLEGFFDLKAEVSGKTYDFTLLPSVSNEKKRVFISKLSERETIISLIRKKNNFPVVFTNKELSEEASFSLRGSSKAITKSSSSLSQACGGISIL